jgi:hypothetical protein
MWESGCAFYGSILWLLFLDEQNFGNESGNVDVMSVLMGVFYGYPFGWTEILQWMNVGVLWVPFWMDRNFAMNECGC